MKELRDKRVLKGLLAEIETRTRHLPIPIPIMEVCGTHTMTLHRYGLKPLLEKAGVEMLSGPGCPVCITPNAYHEAAIGLVSSKDNLILSTFGDMTRVPTEKGALQTAVPAPGSEVKIVYSPEESLDVARKSPQKEVVFFGVGFETTIPAIAAALKAAVTENLDNYTILSALWLIPPPLRAIIQSPEIALQGFLYPGHVSAIIGTEAYRFVADEHGLPGAVAGFEPADMLLGILSILDQITRGRPEVANEYARVVKPDGNPKARALMAEMLDIKDVSWRGLGTIPKSGLKIKPRYRHHDAEFKHKLRLGPESGDLAGCRCGEVLQGKITPPECPLFGRRCRPDAPHGPCMVSFEGACLAYYKYGRR